MKLVKRTTLQFQEGTSDKVYEVDLCLMGDLYTVNFRYGRRGSNLKEGTKTTQPVSLSQAQRVFDGLVAEKVKKGYRDINNISSQPSASPVINVSTTSSDPRHQTILNRLANRNENKWKLERVIWRAGELKIKEATPFLVELIGSGDAMRDYCIAWALGWCGDSAKETLSDRNDLDLLNILYRQFYENPATPKFVKRIAWEAIFKLSDRGSKDILRSQKIRELPIQLQELVINGAAKNLSQGLQDYLLTVSPILESIQAIEKRLLAINYYSEWRSNKQLQTEIKAEIERLIPELEEVVQKKYSDYYHGYFEIQRALKEYISNEEGKHYSIIDTLYQIDNVFTRSVILDLIKTAPLKHSYFRSLRHIFKMAEYRHDTEIYAIFAARFDKEKGNSNSYYTLDRAYTKKTRQYLQKRVWRTLKQLGEESDRDYINLVTEILLQYSDNDAQTPRRSNYRKWNSQTNSYENSNSEWDAYASYIILNHILYENSPRYLSHPKAWRCQNGYQPGNPLPKSREEAFPQLWQQNPEALLKLLLESNCHPVHQFATKALRDCPEFGDRLELNILIQLLDRPYPGTIELAFNLVCDRYNPNQPDRQLILALVNCHLSAARDRAYTWIEAQREYFLNSENFLISLILCDREDTRAFAKRFLSSSILNENATRVLIGQIIAHLLAFSPEQEQIARETGEILLEFTPQLRSLGFNVILDLLNYPLPEVKEIGARILLNHQTPATDLPPNLIESLIASPYESIRRIGVRIFEQLPDDRLMSDRVLIVAMAINPIVDLRNAIRPVIRRLANNYPNFGRQIAIELIDLLTTPEQHQGVHQDLTVLLKEDIPNWMPLISKQQTMPLLRVKSTAVQELAGLILQANDRHFLEEFATNELVKLANHEILSVREAARNMFAKRIETIHSNTEEMLSAVRLLEAKWQDTKDFARKIFSNLTSENWTPELIIYVCDSVYEEVRSFGRNKAIEHFQTDYGKEYLLKFSEHPSADMQIFATNYLENYAANNLDRLIKLTPYFITVLSRVNKGRIAKQRIFQFLDKQAQNNQAAAKIVAEILTRQSVTIAIGDKANAIQIMLKIQKKYPDISLPIQQKKIVHR
ncbi:MAG: WGR domain-containing protein [Xenococcaceae cyanobacterium]